MILVTGGTGYIGSHTVVDLLNNNQEVVIVDNLCNSKVEVLNRIEKITGKRPLFYEADVRNYEKMREIFKNNKIEAIINFAGLKAVGESVEKPLEYYENNLDCVFILIRLMKEFNVKNFVFSSSATVYGSPNVLPIPESYEPLSATNPYGKTKLFTEYILKDIAKVNKDFNIAILRYFNPIGAHPSGLIGEDPNGIPNNLLPYVAQVAVGKLKEISVFGSDYETKDGTGVRDYIHVCDLARGHYLAIKKLFNSNPGLVVYNLGTGKGYSVLEIIKAYEKACNKKLSYKITSRRKGDVAACYADPALAEKELGFKTEFDIEEMCRDSWNWQKNNPNGYEDNAN